MEEYFLYFDESGNLGTDGRYFVIACIITKDNKELENKMKKVLLHIKRNYKDVKWNRHEIKANSCKPKIKRIIYDTIMKKDIQIAYVVADKIWVEDRLKDDKNCLYNYLLRILLENFKKIFRNNKINLILDNKTIKVKSINSFTDYIRIYMNYELGLNSEISVKYMDSSSKKAYNIQAVDYVANAIFAKYEYGYNDYYDLLKQKICCNELFPRRKFGNPTKNMLEASMSK
ncbi:hypothetical protein K144316041_20210 [Clostridium tetani]|uniref:DUF3800 domain-containing protein n=1 Tax=Clostridium tetani TaxID=1513 RepID=UPI0029550BFE|nr:DUF3800 domain-containing protein [Clostridium tetani]BDR73313.1 hypothetical protein K144316041_20210 [Clostridium tetani]